MPYIFRLRTLLIIVSEQILLQMASADPDTSNREDTSENSPGKEEEKSEEASERDFEVSRTQLRFERHPSAHK